MREKKVRRPSLLRRVMAQKPASSGIVKRTTGARRRVIIIFICVAAAVGIAVTAYLIVRHNQQPADELTGIAREYQKKLPELQKKVEANKDDVAARKEYAVALYASKDLKGARGQYGAAIKLNENDAAAHNNLANVYRDLGQTDKAIASYEKAIELNPKSSNTYSNLASVQLYTQEDSDAAIATYKKGIEAVENKTQLKVLLAIAYEYSEKTSEAVETYREILREDSENQAAKAALDRLQ